ncbi:dTDP-4-dehydrorhamnose reductase [Amorphus coralli]|uniref:dTDP-4-dehydrorhamnose reductase n=1 Tax=Amorphus coralli TaxID=340680 RepID=UPI000367FACB|nr:dTDP-4-dehydrorhamnose reductase [Amorphus coralli]
MRIAVIGRSGQLARALAERAETVGWQPVFLGRPELDLASPAGLAEKLASVRPTAILNAAAYTDVDRAESEVDVAHAINVEGAEAVARAAAALGVPVIHVSSDYVFDGSGARPWRETDPTHPLGVYGATKLASEDAVRNSAHNCAILRTSWVHAPYGRNFVRTMLRLAEDREAVKVVDDQVGAPTYAGDLAEAALAVAFSLATRPGDMGLRGIFHVANGGEASWADVAETAFAVSAAAGGPSARVIRIASADYPTPARRPLNSRLDTRKLATVHGIRLPDWRSSLRICVERIIREGTIR